MFEKLKQYVSPQAPTCTMEYMVVALGNPGTKYENTRHNIGFMAMDRLCQKFSAKCDRLKFKSLCGEAMIGGKRTLLLKPSTFMNLSGEAVVEAMQFYKLEPENVIVIYDDISLDVGKMRIRRKGSHGGHNGMKNIIYLSGKDTFPRIKVGVGQKPHPDYDLADWVLSRFTDQDLKQLSPTLDQVVQAVELMISGKTDQAMNQFNS